MFRMLIDDAQKELREQTQQRDETIGLVKNSTGKDREAWKSTLDYENLLISNLEQEICELKAKQAAFRDETLKKEVLSKNNKGGDSPAQKELNELELMFNSKVDGGLSTEEFMELWYKKKALIEQIKLENC